MHGNNEVVILAVMLYSDATQLCSTGKRSAWPIMMSLANLPEDLRGSREGFKLLGLFPEVVGRKPTHQESAKIFSKCLNELLTPLKQLSNEGFTYNGKICYPLLYAYVSDYPEGSKVQIPDPLIPVFMSNLPCLHVKGYANKIGC